MINTGKRTVERGTSNGDGHLRAQNAVVIGATARYSHDIYRRIFIAIYEDRAALEAGFSWPAPS